MYFYQYVQSHIIFHQHVSATPVAIIRVSYNNNIIIMQIIVCFWRSILPVGQDLLIHEVSKSHTTTHTCGRTPLDEWSARRRDLYLTTHNTHNRKISVPPVRFEPTVSSGEWPQTYALDRAATGNGIQITAQTGMIKPLDVTLDNNTWLDSIIN